MTQRLNKQWHKKIKIVTFVDSNIIFVEVPSKSTKPSINDDMSMQIISSPYAIENLEISRNKIKLNIDLSILYSTINDIWNRPSIAIDESFAYMIAKALFYKEEDPKPQTIKKVMHHFDWLKWKIANKEEYASLYKRKVFGPIVDTLTSYLMEYKMVLICKQVAKGQINQFCDHWCIYWWS